MDPQDVIHVEDDGFPAYDASMFAEEATQEQERPEFILVRTLIDEATSRPRILPDLRSALKFHAQAQGPEGLFEIFSLTREINYRPSIDIIARSVKAVLDTRIRSELRNNFALVLEEHLQHDPGILDELVPAVASNTQTSLLGVIFQLLHCPDLGDNPSKVFDPLPDSNQAQTARGALAQFVDFGSHRRVLCKLILTVLRRRKLLQFMTIKKEKGFGPHAQRCIATSFEALL